MKDLMQMYREDISLDDCSIKNIVEEEVKNYNSSIINRWKGEGFEFPYGEIQKDIFVTKYFTEEGSVLDNEECAEHLRDLYGNDETILNSIEGNTFGSVSDLIDFCISSAFKCIYADIESCCRYAHSIVSYEECSRIRNIDEYVGIDCYTKDMMRYLDLNNDLDVEKSRYESYKNEEIHYYRQMRYIIEKHAYDCINTYMYLFDRQHQETVKLKFNYMGNFSKDLMRGNVVTLKTVARYLDEPITRVSKCYKDVCCCIMRIVFERIKELPTW